ncbi:MAG TPA: stalk domain-containing protein [Chthonomonadaceae bacterium]|nr:stalk domain-containing protein [Chthonomonadaceae bacterium]
MKRMARAIALASGTGILCGAAVVPALAHDASDWSGLHLAITAPVLEPDDSTVTLTVLFHDGNIRSIALFVDGKQIDKETVTTHKGKGSISFRLDKSLLAEGSHQVLVRAIDTEGNPATATAQVTISSVIPDTPAPTHFLSPREGAMVQGIVPVEIKVDPTVHNPYVSFMLDSEFLALTNFGPFTYNWDTTRVSNGSHKIGVDVYDGDTLARVASLSMQVVVNNPGGFTHKQKETPDLRKQTKAQAGSPAARKILDVARSAPQSALPADRIDPIFGTSPLQRGILDATASNDLRAGTPGETRLPGSVSHPAAPSRTAAAAPVAKPNPAPTIVVALHPAPGKAVTHAMPVYSPRSVPFVMEGHSSLALISPASDIVRTVFTPGTLPHSLHIVPPILQDQPGETAGGASIAARPADVHPTATVTHPTLTSSIGPLAAPTSAVPNLWSVVPASGRLLRQPIGPRRAGSIALRPSLSLDTPPPAQPAVPGKPAAIARITPIATAAHPKSRPAPVKIADRMGGIDVAFDDSRLTFDVPPRVENGVPLAPFRPIFEHTGGSIQWLSHSKTVRAANADHKIEFKIGSKKARVNKKTVTMQNRPYIDRGRSIVPLSFVRDALDVHVHFDAATGHLLIESKRYAQATPDTK